MSQRIFGFVYQASGPRAILAVYHVYFCAADDLHYFIVFLFVFLLLFGQHAGERMGHVPIQSVLSYGGHRSDHRGVFHRLWHQHLFKPLFVDLVITIIPMFSTLFPVSSRNCLRAQCPFSCTLGFNPV